MPNSNDIKKKLHNFIGEVNQIIIPDSAFVDNDIDLEASCSVGISGLNTYYTLKKIGKFPYARLGEIPQF